MTTEEQRIAIAEACGWSLTPLPQNPKQSTWCIGGVPATLPNYQSDLNAIHEAESIGLHTEKLKIAFKDWLTRILPGENPSGWNWRHQWHATAAQRAEAFLRTLNLWKD